MNKIFSNEIVFRGHPDKVADQVSDALLMAYLEKDPNSRVAIETMGGKGMLMVTGEVSSNSFIDVYEVIKKTLKDAGYNPNIDIINNIGKQSRDIAQGVDTGGAGDNGMMFGYACNETPQLLPKAMVILQEFSKAYDRLRKTDKRFLSDGKAQITGKYKGNKLTEILTATICYQNTEKERKETDKILKDIFNNIVSKYSLSVNEYLINPTGKFLVGGFEGDAGLTGRKIVVDTYHSFARVGGGAFSGKDPTKVDRSGAYKAREIAKETLKEQDLEWCEVQLSYAIGVEKPLAIYINSNKGLITPNKELYNKCKPKNIIKDLELIEKDYSDMAAFGHFQN